MSIFKPEIFQGSLSKNRYFEGWYFKHVSANRQNVLAFIPGVALTKSEKQVALTKSEKHAFIQVIDGISGKTWNVNYPLSEFSFSKSEFKVRVGNSYFSADEIKLEIDSPELKISGKLEYSSAVKYPSSAFSPGIMGWYSFVPFMECKHGIVSVQHKVEGRLEINESFPESWIWLHCNTFSEPECSFTFSVAKIPWLGNFFIGHICFLYLKGKFYRFATYNGSKITKLEFKKPFLEIELKNKNLILKVKAEQQQAGELKAPMVGEMNRMIKESVDSNVEISLFTKNGQLLFKDSGTHAGLEIIEKILSYF